MRFTIILVFGLTIFLAVPVSATIINVPADQSTIQAGIDTAINGDTVLVQPGTYLESINFNGKNIVVGSLYLTTSDSSYISSTIIDSNSIYSVVFFISGENNTAVITGFTIQGAQYAVGGGGISCQNSNPTITHNIIRNNFGSEWSIGGGIGCFMSSPLIAYNIIYGNYGTGGGGIMCYTGSNPRITDNIISGNTAEYGGGICCFTNSMPEIGNNTIISNFAADGGGGIWVNDVSVTSVYGNTIYGNQAFYGGGIYVMGYNGVLGAINTISWSNTAGADGNEIYIVNGGSVQLEYCDIQGGWEGTGNIDCDPLFCDPINGDFHLNSASCCAGAGQDGVDIGAYGVGCGEPVPILSEWGMILMALLLIAGGTVAIIRKRRTAVIF